MSRLLRSLALLAALLLAATGAFAQTTPVSVGTSWVSLGYGPLDLQAPAATAGQGQFLVSDAQPSGGATGRPIPVAHGVLVATTSQVWAIAPGVSSPIAVNVTPLNGEIAVTDSARDASGAAAPVTDSTVNASVQAARLGTANFAAAQASVGTSATLISAARTGGTGVARVAITLVNACAQDAFLGPTSGVTTSSGGRLKAGAALTLNTSAAFYGVVASGTCEVDAWETY